MDVDILQTDPRDALPPQTLTWDSTIKDLLAATCQLSPDLSGSATPPRFLRLYANRWQVNWQESGLPDPQAQSTVDIGITFRPVAPSTITYNPTPPSPPPSLTSLSPNTIASGGTGFTLTINGTGFVDGSQVNFGSAGGLATFVSDTQLTFQVGAAGYAAAGTIQVSVTPPGGQPSNQLAFAAT